MDVYLPDPDATQLLGERLGRALSAGTVVGLIGDLGAGKTALSRGIARGFGIAGRVQSPSFVIAQVHEGPRGRLVHADLYRVSDGAELDAIGFGEMIDGALALIEWADRFPEALPADRLEVRITEEGDGRRVRLVALGAARLPEGL